MNRIEALVRILECQYTDAETREAVQIAILAWMRGANP